jgi:Rab3 GTPase-activating protein catalytic subunit
MSSSPSFLPCAELFEILDHTAVSPLEQLASDLQKSLTVFLSAASEGDPSVKTTGRVMARTEAVPLPPFPSPLSLTLYSILPGPAELFPDFPTQTHLVKQWLGVDTFLLLEPPADHFLDNSAAALVLGAMELAMASLPSPSQSTQSTSPQSPQAIQSIPVLVPLHNPAKGRYLGRHSGGRVQIEFSVGKREPLRLDQAMALFGSLARLPEAREGPSQVRCSVRFTFTLRAAWGRWDWAARAGREAVAAGVGEGLADLWWDGVATAVRDPVEEVELCTVWKAFDEGAMIDNAVYSDLDPRGAPGWILKLPPTGSHEAEQSSLSALVTRVLASRTSSAASKFAVCSDALHSPVLPGSEPVPAALVLDNHLRSLFSPRPGAYPDSSAERRLRLTTVLKASGLGLLGSLSLRMGTLSGPRAMLCLWTKFVEELRWFWDKGVAVPGVAADVDHRRCLIDQKMSLLNQCIAAKAGKDPGSNSKDGEDGEEEEEEVFEEAREDANLGRKRGLGWALACGAEAYEPDCVPAPPLTEDMAAEREQHLAALGGSEQAILRRAKVQSLPLSSDMSAFKAANPGATLPDFVRWHSPRDWVEGGTLSSRMSGDNLWSELWALAPATPAHLQPALFDPVAEAERALHYLEALEPDAVLSQLGCVAVDAACAFLAFLSRTAVPEIPSASAAVADLVEVIQSTFSATPSLIAPAFNRALGASLASAEKAVLTAISVAEKVPHPRLAAALAADGEVAATGDEERGVAEELFAAADSPSQRVPDPDQREYVLVHKDTGQRMYCSHGPAEFRVALVTRE